MQRSEGSGAVRPIYGSLGVKRLKGKYIRSVEVPSDNPDCLIIPHLSGRARVGLTQFCPVLIETIR